MITKMLIFFLGAFVGMLTTALAAAAGNADKCAECQRRRNGKAIDHKN